MVQKLWTLAYVLALLRTWLDFFHDGTEGDGTLETQGQIPRQINHLATPQSLCMGLWNACLTIPWTTLISTNNICISQPSQLLGLDHET